MKAALIVDDGWSRGALAAARALRSAGWRVGAASPEPGLAAASRSVEHWHAVPRPGAGLDAYSEAVGAAVRAGSYDVVLGAGDADVLALSERRHEIDAIFPYGPHSSITTLLDRMSLGERATACGLEVPERAGPTSTGAVVVKSRRPWVARDDVTHARFDTRRYPSFDAATARIEEIETAGGGAVVERAVDGRLVAVTTLIAPDGAVVARVQQRADITWPRGAGNSARATTEAVDEALAVKVESLLRDIGWSGLAQAQFLVVPGRATLIDVNGRIYGSLSLAIAAGVNLPALWLESFTGTSPHGPPTEGRAGVRYQWFHGDLANALRGDGGSKLASAARVFVESVRSRHSVVDPRDPKPALAYLRHVGRR